MLVELPQITSTTQYKTLSSRPKHIAKKATISSNQKVQKGKVHYMKKEISPQKKTSEMDLDGLIVVDQPKFRVITCDCPWSVNQQGNYGAIKHYNLMTQEELKNMPIADLCEGNACVKPLLE